MWSAVADPRVGGSGYLQPEVLLGRNWSSGSSPTLEEVFPEATRLPAAQCLSLS